MLYSVPALQLFDFSLSPFELKIQLVGLKGFSDGMAFSRVWIYLVLYGLCMTSLAGWNAVLWQQ